MKTMTDPTVYARRWKILGVLSLSLLIIGLDNTVLNVALPTLQSNLHASASSLEWIVDSYLLVFAGLLLTAGTLGDRFGRKPALQCGIAIFGIGSLIAGFASSTHELIALRGLMGVGGALIMPATLSIITNVFPREERGKAIGAWSAMAALGIGLGPLLGGIVIDQLDWRWVFWINVPVCLIAIVAGALLVPNSRDPRPGAFDVPGALLSIGGLLTLVYAIIEAPSEGWLDPQIVALFIVSAVLAVAFLVWERRTASPMLELQLFRNRRFSIAAIAVSCASFALMAFAFLLTQYLQFAHGYSALGAGAAMTPLALGLVMGAGGSHKSVARFGTTRVVAAGLLGLSLVLAASLLWTPTMGYAAIGLTMFAVAFSLGNVLAPATDSVMGAAREEHAGVASAMNDVTRQVAGALGVAVIGSITSTIYQQRVDGDLPPLPGPAHDLATSSIGAANAVAAHLPPVAANLVTDAAGRAFTDALGIGLGFAAAVSAAAAVIVARRLPAHHADEQPVPATGRDVVLVTA